MGDSEIEMNNIASGSKENTEENIQGIKDKVHATKVWVSDVQDMLEAFKQKVEVDIQLANLTASYSLLGSLRKMERRIALRFMFSTLFIECMLQIIISSVDLAYSRSATGVPQGALIATIICAALSLIVVVALQFSRLLHLLSVAINKCYSERIYKDSDDVVKEMREANASYEKLKCIEEVKVGKKIASSTMSSVTPLYILTAFTLAVSILFVGIDIYELFTVQCLDAVCSCPALEPEMFFNQTLYNSTYVQDALTCRTIEIIDSSVRIVNVSSGLAVFIFTIMQFCILVGFRDRIYKINLQYFYMFYKIYDLKQTKTGDKQEPTNVDHFRLSVVI